MPVTITNGYATLAQLKAELAITVADHDDRLSNAINAASRSIDNHTNRYFYIDGTSTTPVVLYFTPTLRDSILVDDFTSISAIATDTNNDLTWSTVWASTDWVKEPINNPRQGKPFYEIIARGGYSFLIDQPQSLKVTGIWGWSAVPEVVRQACLIQASRLFNRAGSPFGIAGSAELGTVRLAPRLDVDVQVLLTDVTKQTGLAT